MILTNKFKMFILFLTKGGELKESEKITSVYFAAIVMQILTGSSQQILTYQQYL